MVRQRFSTRFGLWALVLSITGVLGCDQLPWGDLGSTSESNTKSAAQAEAERRAAEEKARAQERARKQAELEEERARKQAEKEKAAAQVAECCRALAKAGFEGRSMELMAATDVCEAAQKESKVLSDFRSQLEDEVSEESLPDPCLSE